MGRWFKWATSVAIAMASLVSVEEVRAQTIETYNERIKSFSSIAALPEDAFGERYNYYKGELSFFQTDMSLAGTGPLLTLGRDYVAGRFAQYRGPAGFADWGASIPRIVTKSPKGDNLWVVGKISAHSSARCSQFSAIPFDVSLVRPGDWWTGYQLITEDGQTQELLKRSAENRQAVNGDAAAYPIVTANQWQIGCLTKTANGVPGEGFLAISPQGTKYWFNWLVLSDKSILVVREMPPPAHAIRDQVYVAMMLVTRIEDRFGNALTYSYDGNRLTEISASDGRKLRVNWLDATKIGSITLGDAASTRTWTYAYATATDENSANFTYLASVTNPDRSRWGFNLTGLYSSHLGIYAGYPTCTISAAGMGANDKVYTGTITHPSGIVGTFSLKQIRKGRSNVPLNCHQATPDTDQFPAIPADYYAVALQQRTYSGPGIDQTWRYTYGPINASWQGSCGSGCPTTVTVDETLPSNHVRRYTFSNEWGAYEGKLLKTEEDIGGTAQAAVINTYASTSGMPYPSVIGTTTTSTYYQENDLPLTTLSPLSRRETVQDGNSYNYKVNAFDAFARPVSVTRSSP